jgi:prepilin-type N-terminal cleavage/methylation domain-containing protein
MLTRLDDERGMTLPEVLVAMVCAVILSLAAFALVDVVMARSGEVNARVDTTQRARGAMDDVTRSLRSQVCVTRSDPTVMTAARSVFSASKTQVVFFAETSSESYTATNSTMPIPTLRTLSMQGTTLKETVRPGNIDITKPGLNAITFASATGERTRSVLTDVKLATDPATGADVPLFRYYAWNTATKAPDTLLDPGSGSLTESQLQQVAKIAVSYRVQPTIKSAKRGSIVLQNDITVRSVDPNSSTPKPICT